MNEKTNLGARVIGFDAHPDSFTAAMIRGPIPAAAVVEKIFNKVPMAQLCSWAKKHTSAEDLVVLEASGNSFQVVRTLATIGRRALVLESCQLGQLKEAHANNDRISAVRIGKAYLAGTAKEVWVPDPKTQERRDWFHAHRKAVKRTTQMRNRLHSYLSDNGVRLKKGTRLAKGPEVETQIRQAKPWSVSQWLVIEGLLMELRHAHEQRAHWRRLIAQEVLTDPQLLSLVRLGGVRDLVAFALGALIGDIHRFGCPKKLVKYIGLNPAFDDSGQSQWSGGIGGHGRKDLRCLLIEAAHAILRSGRTSLARWGKKLLRQKGSVNLAVAAIARKLAVAVWYLMMGRWTAGEETEKHLALKVSKILSHLQPADFQRLGKTRLALRREAYQSLKNSRVEPPAPPSQPAPKAEKDRPKKVKVYVLDPNKKFTPKPPTKASSLAVEYGLG